MYNRYIAGAWPEDPANEQSAFSAAQAPSSEKVFPSFDKVTAEDPSSLPEDHANKTKGFSALKGLFSNNIKLPEFNADTILLLVLVYFLVADDTENISDTLLIIGVLLLLGF